MDDSCAVCAETLEWVAYGACGHREVCSTCLARLRCICEDHRCCICKSESHIIFVTKGLGDFTRMINDFSVFPADPAEGQVGSYWYHEDTQAYFDDFEQYKMIKAMCRLSCSVCDKFNEQNKEWVKRKAEFKNIEQLKGHLFHQHNLFMCCLCLEGRKIFISEQKLYTRAQLNQHVKTGDSVVDGSDNERGGFTGHPLCEFCLNPFYGENELYQHMSTEHYTCHLCQRQYPGQYEYYKNYDDLEIHFRQEHFLCEDESCLAKKFIVFPSESEMKRHNAKEHGGQMSRSKRNAALQIPTSFRYRRNNEQDRRGRGRGFRRDSPDELASAIEASLEIPDANTSHDSGVNTQLGFDHVETNEVEPVLTQSESLVSRTEPQPTSMYRVAVQQDLHGALFPPLPAAPNKSKHKSMSSLDGLGGNNTIAARLRRNNIGSLKVLNKSTAWPSVSHQSSLNPRPSSASASANSSSDKATADYSNAARAAASSSSAFVKPNTNSIVTHKGPFQSSFDFPPFSPATQKNSVAARAVSVNPGSLSENSRHTGPFLSSAVDFPPVPATQKNKQINNTTQPLMTVVDIYAAANKSLVERIRAALGFDEDKYGAFKIISADYRKDLIDTWEYVANVHQFGLSHLLLELARLCPDPQKQKMLVEIYMDDLKKQESWKDKNGTDGDCSNKFSATKGKAKCDDMWGSSKSKDGLSNGVMNTVRSLQANYKPSEEEVVLSKDGYRSANSKSKIPAIDGDVSVLSGESSRKDLKKNNSGNVESGNKQQKKTSKFMRMRLGEDSPAAVLDLSKSETRDKGKSIEKDDSPDGVVARGVWKNGGGQRLVGKNYHK